MIDRGWLVRMPYRALKSAVTGCAIELRCAEVWDPEADGELPEDAAPIEEIKADLQTLIEELKARDAAAERNRRH